MERGGNYDIARNGGFLNNKQKKDALREAMDAKSKRVQKFNLSVCPRPSEQDPPSFHVEVKSHTSLFLFLSKSNAKDFLLTVID